MAWYSCNELSLCTQVCSRWTTCLFCLPAGSSSSPPLDGSSVSSFFASAAWVLIHIASFHAASWNKTVVLDTLVNATCPISVFVICNCAGYQQPYSYEGLTATRRQLWVLLLEPLSLTRRGGSTAVSGYLQRRAKVTVWWQIASVPVPGEAAASHLAAGPR